MIEIAVYFNKATNTCDFACKPGTEKRQAWVNEGYKVERSVYGYSPCGNLLYGDYYLYKGDNDDQAWTCQEAIEAGIISLDKPKPINQDSVPSSVKIGIFKDANGNRHALPVDVYELFRKSTFWKGCKHVTQATRTNLDARTVKAIDKTSTDFHRIYVKSGMFDLIKQNWTFGGEVTRTDKQATAYNNHLTTEAKQLKSWERSMKRMDMLPSAAGVILGKMSEQL